MLWLLLLPTISICGPLEVRPDFGDLRMGSNFDYLMLTRIYPTAVCRADDDSVPDSCEIPPSTPAWSVHGLWPNYSNGSYPQFCDGIPKKFDAKLIESIRTRLESEWPNLYPTKSADSFWKHEWEKHGTCGESDHRLSSELMYFQATIDLNLNYDVGKALAAQGITPSMIPIKKTDIQKALNNGIGNGGHVQFNCLMDKKMHKNLLADVRICIDRDFAIISCPTSASNQPVTEILGQVPLPTFRPCPEEVYYLPAGNELQLGPKRNNPKKEIPSPLGNFFTFNPLLTWFAEPIVQYMTIVLIIAMIAVMARENCTIANQRKNTYLR